MGAVGEHERSDVGLEHALEDLRTNLNGTPLGLIAGNGSFPDEFLRNARRYEVPVVAVAHNGETEAHIADLTKACLWVRVGQLGRIIRFFKKHGVTHLVFVGGITRVRLFGSRGVRPDWRALQVLARTMSVRDDALLRAIAGEIEQAGIKVIDSTVLLRESVARAGCLTRRDLTEREEKDARVGWEVAEIIGGADIGQTIVIKDGLVVAVEAVEGTDQTIRRAGELAGQGCVVVKLPKPQQDLRFDLPAVGQGTISSMQAAGASALVLKESGAIIHAPGEFVRLAEEARIAVRVYESGVSAVSR